MATTSAAPLCSASKEKRPSACPMSNPRMSVTSYHNPEHGRFLAFGPVQPGPNHQVIPSGETSMVRPQSVTLANRQQFNARAWSTVVLP
jgi:hypothetical protein